MTAPAQKAEPAQKANTTMIDGKLRPILFLAKVPEDSPIVVDDDTKVLLKAICTAYCNKGDSSTTLELRTMVDYLKATSDNLFLMTNGIGKPMQTPNKADMAYIRATLTGAGLVAIPRPGKGTGHG